MAYRELAHDVALLRTLEASEDIAPLIRIHARRVARTIAGTIAAAGGAMMFIVAYAIWIGRWASGAPEPDHAGGVFTKLLFASAAAAIFAYPIARLVTGRTWSARLRYTASGDPARDLVRIEAARASLLRALEGGETVSVAMPMAALSLLVPLLSHFVVGTMISGDLLKVRDFDGWIFFSVLLVGHAHFVLVGMCVLAARRMRRTAKEELEARGPWDWLLALGVTVAAGAVPGIVLLLIPPLIVLVTGVAFIPAMFVVMRTKLRNERLAICPE
jgi:hypothetical protein